MKKTEEGIRVPPAPNRGQFFEIKSSVNKIHIIKWISRSSKYALNAEKASHDLIELPNKRKALSFKKNRYFTDDILFFPNHSGSYGFFCLTFRCVGHELQTVISNHQQGEKYFHEIWKYHENVS